MAFNLEESLLVDKEDLSSEGLDFFGHWFQKLRSGGRGLYRVYIDQYELERAGPIEKIKDPQMMMEVF